MDDRERSIRQRLKSDFEHYAARCLRIRTKSGDIQPLLLNSAQRFLHGKLEDQRERTGKVRALILKGRQQGCSTYVEGRFYHRVTHARGLRAYIMAHEDDSSKTLFEMAKRYHEHCPSLVKPHTRASNAKELVFDLLDSGYEIATAGTKGTGRSKTVQLFHGSEVAFWPHADEHRQGALQTVPNEPGTEIIFESTSAGPVGVFHEMWQAATEGRGEFEAIFIPWFWQDEYRAVVPEGFAPTSDEQAYADEHGLDLAQLAWMRTKTEDMGGVGRFRREYPATPAEAFAADVVGALWTRELIDRNRVSRAPDFQRIVVAIDPAGTHNAKSDETGIGVAGLGLDSQAYVLEDLSCKETPQGWASRAVSAFHRWKADRIIAETNYGGEMVEAVIRSIDPNVPVKVVTATRGKAVRAEPVVGLDEQGRVHHVGRLMQLEDQMCTWVPGVSEYSPDRIDWRVWAITELMLEGKQPRLRVL